MYGKGIPLFKLFGFEVKIELSWLILAGLIVWSLATSTFPGNVSNLAPGAYLWMGVAGALGLFASIIFHELLHSLVARRYGLPMKGITLFIFGGVAEMEEEPPSPRSEFLMALAGPVSSMVLALGFYLLSRLGAAAEWSPAPVAVLGYLATINISLAAFNIVPAFPLDGGRVLRSILWSWKNDLRWATRLASRIGTGFGFVLLGLGVLSLFMGQFGNGLWLFVIGMFLQNASRSAYQQIFVREALQGESVSRFMKSDPVTVSPNLSIRSLVDDYVYTHHYKMFPVLDGSELVGCVSTRAISEVPREEWDRRTVSTLIRECSIDNTIGSGEDAMQALSKMSRTRNSRLMVVDDRQLVGVITLKDLLSFLSLKMDLGDGS
jgi:Zn-dependent protease/predicted transcriptional regulator